MPLWCTSSDDAKLESAEPHHRIVRIPPGESVVLNSAEKAPYLLYIEILSDDLDFNPEKRSNREVVKKIILREAEKGGVSKDLATSFTDTSPHKPRVDSMSGGDVDVSESSSATTNSAPASRHNSPLLQATAVNDEEEMDLVEQIYGADRSLRPTTADLTDSFVLPPAPKNRDLDMAAWSTSLPASPALENEPTLLGPSNPVSRRASPGPSSSAGQGISLQEYSERMRTAAIMLSQLNASMAQNAAMTSMIPGLASVPGLSSLSSVPGLTVEASAGPMRWASSWLNAVTIDQPVTPLTPAAAEAALAGPVHPSLRGLRPDGPGQQAPSKMRLGAADAAAIRDRIMQEMLALEEERMDRMRDYRVSRGVMRVGDIKGSNTAEDESIIRKELNKADPSAVVFSESWLTKKVSESFSASSVTDSSETESNTK